MVFLKMGDPQELDGFMENCENPNMRYITNNIVEIMRLYHTYIYIYILWLLKDMQYLISGSTNYNGDIIVQ